MVQWYIITIILAACSIIYELLLATSLSMITGSYVWWHSWTIAFYIGGLSLGSFWANKANSHRQFINIELLLSILGIGTLFIIYAFHLFLYGIDTEHYVTANAGSNYQSWNFALKMIFFIVSQSMVFIIGTLSGYEIPLIMKRVEQEFKVNLENKIIAYNYLGTLLGTLVFTFLLYPFLNLITIGLVVGLFNLLVCVYLLMLDKRKGHALSLGLVVLMGVVANLKIPDLEQIYYKTRYFYGHYIIDYPESNMSEFLKKQKKFPKITRIKSLYQNIDLFTAYDDPQEFKMFLDSSFQFSTKTEKLYHEGFSHLAINMAKQVPKKVLVLGAGDGMLIRELLKYPEIESITHIELDGKVYEMFKNAPLNELNDKSLSHPKVKTMVGDGFYYVRNTNDKFDGIFIDFPYPKSYDLSRLYSIEFYKNINRVLNPQGMVVLDVPLFDRIQYSYVGEERSANMLEEDVENNNVVMSTIYYAGFKGIKPFRVDDETFLLLSKEILQANMQASQSFKSYCQAISQKELDSIKTQHFPYEIKPAHINSIFYPKLVDKWGLVPNVW